MPWRAFSQIPLEPEAIPGREPTRGAGRSSGCEPVGEPEPGLRLRHGASTSRPRSRTAAKRPTGRTTATGTTTGSASGVGILCADYPERRRPSAADVPARRLCRTACASRPETKIGQFPGRASWPRLQSTVLRSQRTGPQMPMKVRDVFTTYRPRERPALRHAHRHRLRRLPLSQGAARRCLSSTSPELLHHGLGQGVGSNPGLRRQRASPPGMRPATARASTTAMSGVTSSTWSSSRRQGHPTIILCNSDEIGTSRGGSRRVIEHHEAAGAGSQTSSRSAVWPNDWLHTSSHVSNR